MKEFKDDMGRTWTVHLSCASLKRVAAHAGFDIADITNGKALDLFGGNTTHLLDILWPLVKADAEKREIDIDSFGDGLRGDCMADAAAVLQEELLTFFPSQRRALMQKLLAKMEKVVAEASVELEKEIESVQLHTVRGGNSPTSVQESSESTQTNGLSGNS
jgi:hypothetical protein